MTTKFNNDKVQKDTIHQLKLLSEVLIDKWWIYEDYINHHEGPISPEIRRTGDILYAASNAVISVLDEISNIQNNDYDY